MNMKRFRHVGVYYRDTDGVMKRIPGLKLFIDRGDLVEVYTKYDGPRINLEAIE